jgi:hypothetical protein
MTAPYTKARTDQGIHDSWEISDGYGDVIAILDTEWLCNVMMNYLVNGVGNPPPDFKEETPYGEPEVEED